MSTGTLSVSSLCTGQSIGPVGADVGLFRNWGFFFTDKVVRYGGLGECPSFLDRIPTFLGYSEMVTLLRVLRTLDLRLSNRSNMRLHHRP